MYVHTPLITGSDCEGAGEMFRVTTLDPKNPPLTDEGAVDYSRDFFGKETNLTVSGQLNGETYTIMMVLFGIFIRLVLPFGRKIPIRHAMRRSFG